MIIGLEWSCFRLNQIGCGIYLRTELIYYINMKTCPNPKCKATDIPDDAQFCHKCGANLRSTEKAWDKQYICDKKHRDDLVQKKQLVELFEERRKRFFEVVDHDQTFIFKRDNYILNRKKILRKRPIYLILGLLCAILCGGALIAPFFIKVDMPFLIPAFICPYTLVGAVLFYMKYDETFKKDTTEIPILAKTFIQENYKIYKLIIPEKLNREYSDYDEFCIWEQEVNNQVGMMNRILAYKNDLDCSINDLDIRLHSLEQLR